MPILNVSRPLKSPGSNAVVVLAAQAPKKPFITDLWTPGHVSAFLSHDPGCNWPDRKGQLIMGAVLAERGTVAFLFETVDDANTCRERLITRGGK